MEAGSVAEMPVLPEGSLRAAGAHDQAELIHIDIKKLGRIGSVGHRITGRYPGAVNRHHGIGWEFVHVPIDDASRVAFVQVMANQCKESTRCFSPGRCRLLCQARSSRRTLASDCANLHQTLYAEDQRQGTALHPNRAPRMGPRASLSNLRPSARRNCPTGSIVTPGMGPYGTLKAKPRISRLGDLPPKKWTGLSCF
jgi:hypothetical protein